MQADLLPLHSYFAGDAFCTVVIANQDHTFAEFARSVAEMVCGFRVESTGDRPLSVTYKGVPFDSTMKVRDSGLRPFERVDILCGHPL